MPEYSSPVSSRWGVTFELVDKVVFPWDEIQTLVDSLPAYPRYVSVSADYFRGLAFVKMDFGCSLNLPGLVAPEVVERFERYGGFWPIPVPRRT